MADSTDPTDARPLVDELLTEAVRRQASDVHLEPVEGGYEIRMRIDGLLQTVARYDTPTGRAAVTRLMVMAQLLTYRMDVPQEGRVRTETPATAGHPLEFRLAVMPTTHGPRAAVRTPGQLAARRTLADLALPPGILDVLHRFARADAAGLPIDQAIAEAERLDLNSVLYHRLARWRTAVQNGTPLADAARRARLPRLLVGMLDTTPSDLPGLFRFLSRYYAGRFSRTQALLRAAVIPAVALSMGLLVAAVGLSLFLPLISLIDHLTPQIGRVL